MNHPYIEYENGKLWRLIKRLLRELEKNSDIKITTKNEYVVGFLCKAISNNLKTPKKKLKQEEKRLNKFFGGKIISRFLRHRPRELAVVFSDKATLFVDNFIDGIDFSFQAGIDSKPLIKKSKRKN